MSIQSFPWSGSDPSANSLGLGRGSTQGPPVVFLLSHSWAKKSDDEAVAKTAKRLLGEIDSFAKASGIGCKFRYLNYAASWQDPVASYGVENVKFLRDVSGKYGPEGVFWKLCSGGFKVPR